MSTGKESKVRTGENLAITAELWNDIIDVVRDWKRSKSIQNPGAFTSVVNQALTCLVSNETGIDFVYPFQVVRLEDMNFQPNARTKYAFGKRSVVDAHIPDGPTNHIAVVQGPLQGGGETWGSTTSTIGMAVIRGLTLVRLRLMSAGHQFAVPVAGETGFMESAESGVARIMDYMVEPVQSGEEPIGSEGSGDFYLALIDLANGGSDISIPGDTAGAGSCQFAKLRPTDSILVTDGLEDANLNWDSTGVWLGTSIRGTWEFGYDPVAGLPYLMLDGKKLIPCDDGCYSGGPFTGHEVGSVGDSGPPCKGESFTACVKCCTPFVGYEGPGWYCLRADGVCTPVEILGNGDQCNPWVYCSGPYATEGEADCQPSLTDCCVAQQPLYMPAQIRLDFANSTSPTFPGFSGHSVVLNRTSNAADHAFYELIGSPLPNTGASGWYQLWFGCNGTAVSVGLVLVSAPGGGTCYGGINNVFCAGGTLPISILCADLLPINFTTVGGTGFDPKFKFNPSVNGGEMDVTFTGL